MTDKQGDKVLTRNQPEIPSYFRNDEIGRKTFLSQIGAIGDEYRNLFSMLCEMLEPVLNYKKFINKMLPKFPDIVEMLDVLMEHLEKGRCGILVKALQGDQMVNDLIILTERDSPRFWYWYVENAWLTVRNSRKKPYPSAESFQKMHGFSTDILQRLILSDISSDFIDKHANEIAVYSIQTTNNHRVIATSTTLDTMINISWEMVRQNITKSLQLQTEFSRLLGISNDVLLGSVSGKDDKFWYRFTKAFMDNKEKLIERKINFSAEMQTAVEILSAFIRNELDLKDTEEKEREEKMKAMKSVLLSIAKKRGCVVTVKEFSKLFDPYIERWPDMQAEFGQHYMTAPGRSGLPIVVNIGTDYVYRDHVYILFKSLHSTASSEIKEHYVKKFMDVLRTNRRNLVSIFSSVKSFQDDIKEKINQDYPVLKNLLNQPRIVADGIIHYGTKVLKKSDMNRIKPVLEKYFVSGTGRYRVVDELFGLDLSHVFEEAYSQLRPLRRFLMRLSGRYESYLKMYNPMLRYEMNQNMDIMNKKNPKKRKPQKASKKKTTSKKKAARTTPKQTASRQGAGKPRRSANGSNPSRTYTVKQRESVWSEYQDLQNKK